MTMQMTHTDALESLHRDRAVAQRALRRSELERSQSARALEFTGNHVPFDEARRAELRAAYADAAAAVERHQRVFDRALAIEQAAQVLADALTDGALLDNDAAEGLMQLLEQRQRRTVQRETTPFLGRALRPTPDASAPRR